MATPVENLERLLASGKDGALLRFGLGNAYALDGRIEEAIASFERAVDLDPDYSAAWKALGKALTAAGRREQALAVYQKGIDAARRKGDKQALREMDVFARRLANPGGRR